MSDIRFSIKMGNYYHNASALWWERLSDTERENVLDRLGIKFEHGLHNKWPYLYFVDSVRKKITKFYKHHIAHVHARRGYSGRAGKRRSYSSRIGNVRFPNIKMPRIGI